VVDFVVALGVFLASDLMIMASDVYEKRDFSRINPNLLLKNIFQNILTLKLNENIN
jgi:hypothetical protein